MNVTWAQFTDDKVVVYRDNRQMIGLDIPNAKEIFRSETERQFPNFVFDKPVTFKDGKVFLEI